jgi:hypothetical protein
MNRPEATPESLDASLCITRNGVFEDGKRWCRRSQPDGPPPLVPLDGSKPMLTLASPTGRGAMARKSSQTSQLSTMQRWMAIVDEHGRVVEAGPQVSKEAWHVMLACYRKFLERNGHIRVHSRPPENPH